TRPPDRAIRISNATFMVTLLSLWMLMSSVLLAVEPRNDLPIQKIGCNDLVAVSVYGWPELTRTVRVSEDGYIRLPMLSERIQAKGLMPAELEESIALALQTGELIVDPFVIVTIAEYHARDVSAASR